MDSTKTLLLQRPDPFCEYFKKYIKFMDKCYNPYRFTDHDEIELVATAIKNRYMDDGLDLFDYFCMHAPKYIGRNNVEQIYNKIMCEEGNSDSIIYLYKIAMEDNAIECKNIIAKYDFPLCIQSFSQMAHELGGHNYICVNSGKKLQFYTFRVRHWENNDILIRFFITNTVCKLYKKIITKLFFNDSDYKTMKKIISRVKSYSTKSILLKDYAKIGVCDIKIDTKWWLIGFIYIVYDLKTGMFRPYRRDDYISEYIKYEWRDPTKSELATVNKLLRMVCPKTNERKYFLMLLSKYFELRVIDDEYDIVVLSGYPYSGSEFLCEFFYKLYTRGVTPPYVELPRRTNIISKSLHKYPPGNIIRFNHKITREQLGIASSHYGCEFIEQHKYAFLKILMDSYKQRN